MNQAQVNVIGSVMCKENCDSSVHVTLVRLGGSSKKERETISLTDQSSEFLFPNILPGKYRLEVSCFTFSCVSPFFIFYAETQGRDSGVTACLPLSLC